ncbi:transposase [Methylobacter sp.]|uniref:transposase n=1 Tax=Methylobacter sp. TaxID=2051955 RepID=UPI003DA61B3F
MRNLAMHCLILRLCGSIKIFASRIIKTSLKKRAESHRWADFIMGLIHQIINDQSKTLPFFITRSNVYDRKSVPHLVRIWPAGCSFGGRDYISNKLAHLLETWNITLIPALKKNMKLALSTHLPSYSCVNAASLKSSMIS